MPDKLYFSVDEVGALGIASNKTTEGVWIPKKRYDELTAQNAQLSADLHAQLAIVEGQASSLARLAAENEALRGLAHDTYCFVPMDKHHNLSLVLTDAQKAILRRIVDGQTMR